MEREDVAPVQVAYERRNRDLDPQLVWRGKDEQDWSDLVVNAPPIYIQEKVHPKVLIEDLVKRSKETAGEPSLDQPDLFGDFNGIPDGADKTEFYQHDSNWTNRMILGDSLQVMASLAEREGLRGKVQCIYLDPPYGIKFNSNFQWSTTSKEVKDGKADHITREPEMVKAFRDTWRDGIHSYLGYLRDRLTAARDLLSNTGSIFIQIGEENVHRVRSLLDEVFGDENFVSQISYKTTQSSGASTLDSSCDYLIWFCKDKENVRFNNPLKVLARGEKGATRYNFAENTETGEVVRVSADQNDEELDSRWKFFTDQGLTSRGDGSENTMRPIMFRGIPYAPSAGHWRTSASLIEKRLIPAGRVIKAGKGLRFKKRFDDFGCISLTNLWDDVGGGIQSRNEPKIYVVQTSTTIIQRCLLMAINPGDLILDPTCGAGTTATVAEQWGRRWITIDTSRVALALARARLMSARYPFFLLADSKEGQAKEGEVMGSIPSTKPVFGNIRLGFVCERAPHITLKSIAANAEIDIICENFQPSVNSLLDQFNKEIGSFFKEWEIPFDPRPDWSADAKRIHSVLKEMQITRQKQIDASIAAKAEFETLHDRPYENRRKVRVAGPFTVESLSPHRFLGLNENDDLIPERNNLSQGEDSNERDGFVEMILENLRPSGVQQAHKEDKISFTSLQPWPGRYICAEALYVEVEKPKRAGVFIGPEFGTVGRQDLVEAAREAGDADFDVLIACAFNYDAHSSEFDKLGRIPVLKARMNADLHMSDDLKNTGKGNIFVIFGEPDIDIIPDGEQIQVKINGVDVFDPRNGEVRSDGADGIACWFIDTDYNGESFFVRHAYFLGANDPYKSLKTTLKAEINEEAWSTLNSDISRPFDRPKSGRIAVKVINHLGDEVMKVFRV